MIYTDKEILDYLLNGNGLFIFEICDVRTREDIIEEMNEYNKLWDNEYIDNPCSCNCTKYKYRNNIEYCCFCGKIR